MQGVGQSNQNNGLFNLGGKQVELVIPGINNQVGGFRYLNMLVQMGVLELVERSNSRRNQSLEIPTQGLMDSGKHLRKH